MDRLNANIILAFHIDQMESEKKIDMLLQEKLNLYETLIGLLGQHIIEQIKNTPNPKDLINGGKIRMETEDYIMEGGYEHKQYNLQQELNKLKNKFKIGLQDAIKESFSRMQNI